MGGADHSLGQGQPSLRARGSYSRIAYLSTLDEDAARNSSGFESDLVNVLPWSPQGAPRLGLSPYMWLVETNTGANSECLSDGAGNHKCATTFNGPLGMVRPWKKKRPP